MILHFSHIGFTDGRTFMIPFGVGSRRGGSGDRVGHRYHAPGAHVARLPLARLSATKQNTKRLRRVMSRLVAALVLAIHAAAGERQRRWAGRVENVVRVPAGRSLTTLTPIYRGKRREGRVATPS